MNRMGLSVPSHRPAIVGWAEILAFAYVSYVLVIAAPVYWTQLQNPDIDMRRFLISVIPSLGSLIVLSGAILLTLRRGGKIAFWIGFVLLLSPTTKLVRHFPDLSLGAYAAQAPVFLFSLGAASLLMLPGTRAWTRLRHSELRSSTAGEKKRELYREQSKSSLRLAGFVIGDDMLRFVDIPSTQSEERWFLIASLKDRVPLTMALRKAGKIHSMPDKDLDTELLNLIESRFKDDKAVLQTAQLFMAEHGIPWKLMHSDEEGLKAPLENSGGASSDLPKVGDKVYIPSEIYVSHGADDIRGGLTAIAKVEVSGPNNKNVWIVTEFDSVTRYAWPALKDQQAELQKEFGDAAPGAKPDLRPEFNTGWEKP